MSPAPAEGDGQRVGEKDEHVDIRDIGRDEQRRHAARRPAFQPGVAQRSAREGMAQVIHVAISRCSDVAM
jgi:hypothetical protein